MHLFSHRNPDEVRAAVKRLYRDHPFMVACSHLGMHHLYGCTTNCQDAKIEAATDHPGATFQEIEYLSPERIKALKPDPVSETFKDLGLIIPRK